LRPRAWSGRDAGSAKRAGEKSYKRGIAGRPFPEHADEKGRKERCIYECKYQLEKIHDVIELSGNVRRSHADDRAENGRDLAHAEVMFVGLAGLM